MLNTSQGFARTAVSRLRGEHVVWLTTVDSTGVPQPRPVWFQFDGRTVLIFSQPGGAKLKHVRRHPAVALHLNSDFKGDQVTVFLGEASILEAPPAGPRLEEYVEKYRQGIKDLGYTPESFLAEYSVAVEVGLTRARGF